MGGKSVGKQAAKDRTHKRLKMSFRRWRNEQSLGYNKPKSYPECVSSLKDCPSEIAEPNNPPSHCKFCPMYMDSKFCVKDEEKEKERAKELAGLFKHFGKPKES